MNKITATTEYADVWIYEPIESGLAERIRNEIFGLTVPLITVHINSPGGVVSEAQAAFSLLRSHPARVEVIIDGVAASSASFLAMAGDHITMAENALMMIHNPWTSTAGDARELRRTADALDKHRDVLLQAYSRSRLPQEKLKAMLDAETWLTAIEAKGLGLVDTIHQGEAFAACTHRDHFPNLPERFHNMSTKQPSNKNTPEVLAAERKRRDEVAASFDLMAKNHGDTLAGLRAQCLDDFSITQEKANELILAKLAEGAFPVQGSTIPRDCYGSDPRSDFMAAATDAILMKHGVPLENPHPGARDVLYMDTVDMARTLLSQRGQAGHLSAAKTIQAAMSTSDLPALLENVAYKSLMQGFEESEAATHRAWTRKGTLQDFKAASRVALSEAPGLQQVHELGEYTTGALNDAKETIKLDTYGKIVTVSRQMLVNDDLGSLARLPLAMGQAAARKEADIVYSLLSGNPNMRDSTPLFHANHGNLGTPAELSVGSLGEARKLMRLQRGLAGQATLNIAPRFLIVPASLETDAEKLLVDINATSVAEAVPGWVRSLILVVDSRLDEESETAWYLAAHPEQSDTIEVAHLDGSGVSTETDDGFFQDVTNFKVRLDVGAAVLDWRGLVANAGTN